MAWDWVTPVGSGVVAVAGLVFGWATSVRSQRQTAELAREGNRHAQALAELAGSQARGLEQLRHTQSGTDRRELRLEDSYVEIATTVIRASVDPAGSADDLVRARVLIGLFAEAPVREAFEAWLDSLDKLRYAVGKQSEAGDEPVASTRDIHSPRDMWRRQADDARIKEVEARERLMTAMAGHLNR
ncbi:hypothetical protein KOI35_15810 [Actinoplanes bogorensis]|uniref:Secreted protein n=1 Tax=Paractinoplanes bogorensis TaxID=1610840 RepID=A0ABS5YQG6_9ACTN|nr:hypothetical protein [Actinoplanes bogorensis]MBU2664969.1 hypothetical protein [Actinoplanes bogorensis]